VFSTLAANFGWIPLLEYILGESAENRTVATLRPHL